MSKTIRVGEYLEGAALKAAGVNLVDARPNSRGRIDLLFDDSGGRATELRAAHRTGVLRVKSRDFADAVVTIKNTIFAVRREG